MTAAARMKTKDTNRFDVDALRERAGDKVFARGDAYCRDGRVVIFDAGPERVSAQVMGTEDYRVELTGRGRQCDGACSCRAFEDRGICKHMIAVALATNDHDVVKDAGDGAAAEAMGPIARIRAHLREKGVDALVDMIVDLAEGDPALFRKLDMAAALVQADDKTLEARLRKAIDATTRIRGYLDYRAAPRWAAEVDATLDTLATLASGPRAGLALKLADRALDRIEAVGENIDDSDGHCGGLLFRARNIHLAAASVARPEPVAFARNLFDREMTSDHDAFNRAAAVYADVLGPKGLAEYRRLAVEAWEAPAAQASEGSGQQEFSLGDHRLREVLDVFAEREGDVEMRIALRAKDLSSPRRYLQLAEFCLAQGRTEEALSRAEEGLWVFEDGQPDRGLVFFAAELLAKAGRAHDAQAHLQRAFEKAPSLEIYMRLRDLGGEPVRAYAVSLLEARLVGETRRPWYEPADLLVRILSQETMFDAAWAVALTHGASIEVKERLARASEASHTAAAIAVYATRVEQLAATGGDQSYAAAVAFIGRMADLRSADEQAAYLVALKARHGKKRNLMKLLA